MNYRKIRNEEANKFAKLSATAFHSNAENAYKEIEEGEFQEQTIRVLENDEGKFIAGLKLFELHMWLDTQYVKAGGIGDVASYPEYRRGGNVSSIMSSALKEMCENDYVISYLYPFSHPFYRKYGYELCRKKDIISFETSDIEYAKDAGYVKQHIADSEDDLSEDIKKIYNQYAKKMNFMVNREGWFWDRILNKDAYKSKAKVYVFYLPDDTPIAYFLYQYENIEFASLRAKIFDIAFVSKQAFDVILRFIYKLAPSIKEVVMTCPAIINGFEILDDSWQVKMRSEPGGMMRIVNVQKTLETIKKPNTNSTVVIKVHDKDIDGNNGVYTIKLNNGMSRVIKNDSKEPDMECSVQVLAQLVCGFRCIDEVIHRKDIKVNSKYVDLNKLFVKKPIHIQDFF